MKVESMVEPQFKEYLRDQLLVNFNAVYDGTKFVYDQLTLDPSYSDEAIALEIERYNERNKVKSVTLRQAKLQLLEMGVIDVINDALSQDEALRIEWEYASEVRRDSPLFIKMANDFGFTQNQIDDFFANAHKK